MMPMDPFFSSAHKKHYVPVEGADELYKQIVSMPFKERKAFIKDLFQKKRDKLTSLAESIVLTRLSNEYRFLTYARAHNKMEKKRIKAAIEVKQGKRIPRPVIIGGYGMDSGTSQKQRRALKSRR